MSILPAAPPRLRQIVATALAVVFGIVAGIDIVGTPLAIVAIDHASSASDRAAAASGRANAASNRADTFATALGAAVVRSRVEDCHSQERLRALGRKRLKQKERETLPNLKLLHVEPTPQVLAILHRQYTEERQLLAPVNCTGYGRKALP